MLKNVEVKTYIDEQLERLHNEKTADAQEVLEYLTAVMRGSTQNRLCSLSVMVCRQSQILMFLQGTLESG